VNNQRLDGMGFAPFAYISEQDMKLVDKIYSGHGQAPNQGSIYSVGNSYLKSNFPNLDYLQKATIHQ
jgi:peptidyl-prolyl cis-trans isomerase A (cyclophilin A)